VGKQLNLTGIKARASSILIDLRSIGYGQRTLSIAPNPKNLDYAIRLRAEILGKHQRGTLEIEDYFKGARSNELTFGEWTETWLKVVKPNLASTTLSEYANALRRFTDAWGAKRLGDLTAEDVVTTLASIDDIKAKSFNNIISPLRACLKLAKKLGKTRTDLSEHVEQRSKDQADPPDPLTPSEIDRLMGYAGDWVDYFTVAIYTGMRPSEQIALLWEDVDLKAKTITVRRARVRSTDKTTKTSAIRTVRLPDLAHAALTRQKAISGLQSKVFLQPTSRLPMSDTQPPSDAWKSICKRAGVRSRDARQTRHTYATLMLQAGVKPAFVSKQMGHANSQMFFKTYSKWIDSEDDWREIDKLNVTTGVTSIAK
jgi:integrase